MAAHGDHRCERYTTRGVFCGFHRRFSNPTLPGACDPTRCQAVARGWLVRRQWRLRGPGALRDRRDISLLNDTELVTGTSWEAFPPERWFAIQDAAGVFWFDAGSLWRWIRDKSTPTNPYNRQPLPLADVLRLRRVLRVWGPAEALAIPDAVTGGVSFCSLASLLAGIDMSPEPWLDMSRSNRTAVLQVFGQLWAMLPVSSRVAWMPREFVDPGGMYHLSHEAAGVRFFEVLLGLLDAAREPVPVLSLALAARIVS